MLKSSLCNYRDAYIFVKGTIAITGDGAEKRLDKRKEGLKFKDLCAIYCLHK